MRMVNLIRFDYMIKMYTDKNDQPLSKYEYVLFNEVS
jgi:hypothetical protein